MNLYDSKQEENKVEEALLNQDETTSRKSR